MHAVFPIWLSPKSIPGCLSKRALSITTLTRSHMLVSMNGIGAISPSVSRRTRKLPTSFTMPCVSPVYLPAKNGERRATDTPLCSLSFAWLFFALALIQSIARSAIRTSSSVSAWPSA